MHRRRLGAEFGRDGKFFRREPRSLNDPFRKQFQFSCQKFLMTFLVIDRIFSVFALSLLNLCCLKSYMGLYHISPFLYEMISISEEQIPW